LACTPETGPREDHGRADRPCAKMHACRCRRRPFGGSSSWSTARGRIFSLLGTPTCVASSPSWRVGGDCVGARPPRLLRSRVGAQVSRGQSCLVHDRSRSATWREAVEAIRGASLRGLAFCVHGDYDRRRHLRDRARGVCCCGSLAPTRRGTCVAVREGYGLTPRRSRGWRKDGFSTSSSRSTAGSRPWQRSRRREARARGGRHRPSPAWRCISDCPSLRRSRRLSVLRALRTGVVWKLAEAVARLGHPFLERHLDIVALGTIADRSCRSSTRTARSRSPGCGGFAQTQKPVLRALMRTRPVDPAAVDEGSVGSASRGINAGAALPLRLPRSTCCSPKTARGEAARRRSRGADRERQGRRGADPAPPAVRPRSSPWPESKRRRRRTSSPARSGTEGVIRDRRVAPGRALQPSGRPDRRRRAALEGVGPLDRGVRTSIAGLAAGRGRSRALRRAPRRGRALDRCHARRRRSRRHSPSAQTPRSLGGFDFAYPYRAASRSRPGSRSGSTFGRARATLRRSGSATRASPLLRRRLRADRARNRGRRQAPTVPRPPPRPGRRILRSRSASARSRPLSGASGRVRRGFPPAGEPLERDRRATRLVVRRIFDAVEGYDELRAELARQWAVDDAEASALGAGDLRRAGARRPGPREALLESAAFRRLLEEKPPASRCGVTR